MSRPIPSLVGAVLIVLSLSFNVRCEEVADLLLTGGKIITVDEAFSVRSAIAIGGNRILGVGSDEEMDRYRSPVTTIINLEGRTVMPGLIDSHCHPGDSCVTEFDHPIPEMDSIRDVLDYIRSRADVLDDGEWIRVSQVFLTRLEEQRYPTKDELDGAAPRNPVIFRTGPDASVNTLALELSGIDRHWEVDDGGPGFAEKDPATRELTGILRSCQRYLKYESPGKAPSQEEHYQHLQRLFADYNRVGITGVGERDSMPAEIELYERMRANEDLTVRAYLSKHLETNQSLDAIREELRGVRESELFEGDNLLRVCAAKNYLDGGMLTGSAYMRKPWGVSKLYNISDPSYRGMRFVEHDHLVDIMSACMELDIQFMAHCVGDGAVHGFIDACEALRGSHDIRVQRPVVCHSNFMSEEAVLRAAEMGVCVDIQPAWLFHDGRTLNHHFGDARLTWFQPLRSLFAAGAVAGGGSDHMSKIGSKRSINIYDPWLGIWVTMARRAKWHDDPIHPEQALSRVEAIRFYTINNAYLLQAESDRGSLEAGKLADFIVLDRDIMACPVDDIKETRVLRTYLGGQLVYRDETF